MSMKIITSTSYSSNNFDHQKLDIDNNPILNPILNPISNVMTMDRFLKGTEFHVAGFNITISIEKLLKTHK